MRKQKETYQIDLFANSVNKYTITKPVRLIELFAGVGFTHIGVGRIYPDLEQYHICEWAIPSIIGYDAIHTKNKIFTSYITDKEFLVNELYNLGVSLDYNNPATRKQISNLKIDKLNQIYAAIKNTHNLVNIMNIKGTDLECVETDKYEYIMTYSFPCQSLSLAGKKEGMEVSQKEGGTRSGLVWEVLRVLKECKELANNDKRYGMPQILIMENVPQVHSKDNNKVFVKIQMELEKLGYKNIWRDLNGSDYGVPQNRVRTFMVSIYNTNCDYSFPEPFKLDKFLEDKLEQDVDEKYYLSNKMINFICSEDDKHTGSLGPAVVNKKIASTITTREGCVRCCESNYIAPTLADDVDIKPLVKNENQRHQKRDT